MILALWLSLLLTAAPAPPVAEAQAPPAAPVVPEAPALPPELDALIADAPTADDLPEAEAVYLRHERVFEADANGRCELTLRQTIKVLREGGRRHAVVSLPATRPYQSVSLTAARTVRADGRLVDVRDAALSAEAAGVYGATYGDLTRLQLNFPFVEPGAVIDYEVTLADTRPSQPEGFADRFLMQGGDPILQTAYTVRTPAGTRFASHVHGDLPPPTVRRRGTWDETIWRDRDVPALAEEPNRPPIEQLATWVLVSSTPSWSAVAEQYRSKASPRYVAHTAMRQAVARQIEGVTDRVAALYGYVSAGIRYGYGPLETQAAGIDPRPAYQTFDLRVGDCKDQATLLITMLQEAGVTAWPVLLRRNSRGALVERVPTMLQFDHVLVAVPTGGGFRWLDPTYSFGPAGYVPWDAQGCRGLLVRPDGEQWVDLPRLPPQANEHERSGALALAADGSLSASVRVRASGGFAQSLRWRFEGVAPSAAARLVADGLASLVPSVRLDAESVTVGEPAAPEFAMGYDFSAPGHALQTQRLLLLQMALLERAELPAGLRVEPRAYALSLAVSPERVVNRWRLTIPPELRLVEVPSDARGEESFGRFHVTYQDRGNLLEYEREVQVIRPWVQPDEMDRVRAWYQSLIDADRQFVVMQRRDDAMEGRG